MLKNTKITVRDHNEILSIYYTYSECTFNLSGKWFDNNLYAITGNNLVTELANSPGESDGSGALVSIEN